MNILIVLLVFLLVAGALIHLVTGAMWKSNAINREEE